MAGSDPASSSLPAPSLSPSTTTALSLSVQRKNLPFCLFRRLSVAYRIGSKAMLRTRLLWFGLGFAVTGAAVSQLVWRDLWVDRYALSAEMKEKFDALGARISNLESVPSSESKPAQVEG